MVEGFGDLIPVLIIEHVKGDNGNIERGDKCYIPIYGNTSEALGFIDSELDGFEDDTSLMILLSMEMMSENEIAEMPEFEGW